MKEFTFIIGALLKKASKLSEDEKRQVLEIYISSYYNDLFEEVRDSGNYPQVVEFIETLDVDKIHQDDLQKKITNIFSKIDPTDAKQFSEKVIVALLEDLYLDLIESGNITEDDTPAIKSELADMVNSLDLVSNLDAKQSDATTSSEDILKSIAN